MVSLTVFYLHAPSARDEKILPVMEYGMADAFRAFCRETFDTTEALDYPSLKLIAVPSTGALEKAIFGVPDDSLHFLTPEGRSTGLFMIDDNLMDSSFGDIPLKDWLRQYFPSIPKVVVMHGRQKGALSASYSRRWTKKPAQMFENPERNEERLVHLFKSFWMPRFWTMLRQYVRTKAGTNWHTPGHNGGRAFEMSPFLHGLHSLLGTVIFRSDLSVSVESLGDLSSPEARTPLTNAQKHTAEIFGSARSCYVTNGTSTSNKAMLMTLLRPGERVIIDRNCHKSVHHAVVMSGAVPYYLPARYNARLGVWGPVALGDIRNALAETVSSGNPPRLLILTTCSYEGVLYPVWEIGRMCEESGVLFYADEAWAPYLAFHPYYTRDFENGAAARYAAIGEDGGAHFAAQSTHKALAAFSQASMIHVSSRFKSLLENDSNSKYRWLRRRFSIHGRGSWEKFLHDLHEILRYWHSTSPHYPFLATLDTAGVQMRLEGMRILEDRLRWVAAFRKRVADTVGKAESQCFAGLDEIAGPGEAWAEDGYMHDPLKLILMFKTPKACEQFKAELLKAHIQWEKSSPSTILFLTTVGTVQDHFEYLIRIVRRNKSLIGRPESSFGGLKVAPAVTGQAAVLPNDAALCDGELVQLEECEGRIVSQFVVPYPPGIPVLVPGMRVTKQAVDLLKSVIAANGPAAVHGLFCRGGHAPYCIEVLNRSEESRVRKL